MTDASTASDTRQDIAGALHDLADVLSVNPDLTIPYLLDMSSGGPGLMVFPDSHDAAEAWIGALSGMPTITVDTREAVFPVKVTGTFGPIPVSLHLGTDALTTPPVEIEPPIAAWLLEAVSR